MILEMYKHRHAEFRKYSVKVKSFHEIPSPKGLPFVGTLFSLIVAGGANNLHRYIDKRHKQFGVIFREKLGPITSVFLNDADEIRKVFMHEGRYPKHVLPECWLLYNKVKNYERGLYFMDGEEWFKHRKLLNDVLLKRDYHSEAEKNAMFVEDVFQKWLQFSNDGGQILNLENELYNLSMICMLNSGCVLLRDLLVLQYLQIDSICLSSHVFVMMSFVFGRFFHENANCFLPRIRQLSGVVKDIFQCSVKLSVLPAALAMRLNLKIWTDFVNAVDESIQITSDLLSDAIRYHERGGDDESLFHFLSKRKLSPDLMERILVDFIIAAADTNAYTTMWTLYLLGRHRDVQKGLFVDITRNRENRGKISSIRNVIRESMRLYPIAPFIARYTPEEMSVCSYRIPANQLISLSMLNCSRNDKYFPNADKFQPTRWQRLANGKYVGVADPHATLPFAMGARSCIGRNLSKAQLYFTINKIVSSFEIESLNEVSVKLNLITVPSQPICLRLKKR